MGCLFSPGLCFFGLTARYSLNLDLGDDTIINFACESQKELTGWQEVSPIFLLHACACACCTREHMYSAFCTCVHRYRYSRNCRIFQRKSASCPALRYTIPLLLLLFCPSLSHSHCVYTLFTRTQKSGWVFVGKKKKMKMRYAILRGASLDIYDGEEKVLL